MAADPVIAAADLLVRDCADALRRVDITGVQEVELTGRAALDSLERLGQCEDHNRLLLNMKIFGTKLVRFLENSVSRYHESRWELQKESVMTQVDVIRCVLPTLIESVNIHIGSQAGDLNTASVQNTFLEIMKQSIAGVVTAYKQAGPAGQTSNGLFITKMDEWFQLSEKEDVDFVMLEELVQWLLKHSLTVAKCSGHQQDEEDISAICRSILAEYKNLKNLMTSEVKLANHISHIKSLTTIFELLEQKVNGALLRMSISSFSCLMQPLDTLISKILKSSTLHSARLSDDLKNEIKDLDDQTEKIFQLCHFCIFCTNDPVKAQKIRSAGKVLECVELDLVPAILQLYFTEEAGRAVVRMLRKLWKTLLEEISVAVLDIVDPAAYCVVLLEECTDKARQLKSELYSQDSDRLQASLDLFIGMCEAGVDLAWKEVGERSVRLHASQTLQPLPDDHPLVMAERSIWELRAASKLVLQSIEDLKLHQSLIKRVQVLVSTLGDVVTLLTDQDTTSAAAASNILGSLLVPDIETEETKTKQPPMAAVSATQAFNRTATNCLSFRAKKNLNRTAALSEELKKDLYKITIDLTPFTPPAVALPLRPSAARARARATNETPIRRSADGSVIVRRSSARLSSVLTELSALSHELSLSLDNSPAAQNTPPEEAKSATGSRDMDLRANNSLRRVVLKNILNKPESNRGKENTEVKIVTTFNEKF